jgi:hypothetical protein
MQVAVCWYEELAERKGRSHHGRKTPTMNAKELLQTYLSSIQNAEAAAALFADDGVIELPTVNARARGPWRFSAS